LHTELSKLRTAYCNLSFH